MECARRNRVVYLSGGDREGWRGVVKDTKGFDFVCPRNFHTGSGYIDHWESRAIDILFVYWEKDNPNGYAIALDIGAGLANNIIVILCDARKSDVLEEMADRVHIYCSGKTPLEDGIEALKNIIGGDNLYVSPDE